MKKYTNILLVALVFLPAVASAQLTGIKKLIEAIGELVNISFAVVVGLALLAFFWGLAKFIFRIGGDEGAVEDGKRIMKWGLIALFVMVSVWGIIRFAQRQLDLPSPNTPLPISTWI